MLVVGQDEVELGMVNIRTRDGKRVGTKRVDEVLQMFKQEKPSPSKAETQMYVFVYLIIKWDASIFTSVDLINCGYLSILII
jgi:hypothetical protein